MDIGPEGGDGGGEIVAVGTPEQASKVKTSWTGQYLKPMLERDAAQKQLNHSKFGTGLSSVHHFTA